MPEFITMSPPAMLCTFTLFPNLPMELQNLIWQMTLSEPRAISGENSFPLFRLCSVSPMTPWSHIPRELGCSAVRQSETSPSVDVEVLPTLRLLRCGHCMLRLSQLYTGRIEELTRDLSEKDITSK